MTVDFSAGLFRDPWRGCRRTPAQSAAAQFLCGILPVAGPATRASRLLQYLYCRSQSGPYGNALPRQPDSRSSRFPAPSTVAVTLWGLCITGQLPVHVGASLLRVLEVCPAASPVCARVPVRGLDHGGTVHSIRHPDLRPIRPSPGFRCHPMVRLGEASKVYIIFLGAFFPIIIASSRASEHRPSLREWQDT